MKSAIVLVGFSFGVIACSSSSSDGAGLAVADGDVVADTSAPDSALVVDSTTADSGKDSTVADTFVAPFDGADSTAADDGVAPVDPFCEQHPFGVDKFSHLSRADALAIPFDYRTWVSGQRPDGNTSGSVEKQYFSFVVTTPRTVDVTFGGSKCFAAFYFGSETTSRFSLGGTTGSRYGKLLDAGTYYVEIGDTAPRYFGDGPVWEVYMSWSTPPAACADAGTSD